MTRFRVFGRKFQDYYLHVEAADEHQAVDLANSRPQHDWFPVETDDVIEATDVYLDEDIQLNKDNNDYPEMGSGIIVGE